MNGFAHGSCCMRDTLSPVQVKGGISEIVNGLKRGGYHGVEVCALSIIEHTEQVSALEKVCSCCCCLFRADCRPSLTTRAGEPGRR